MPHPWGGFQPRPGSRTPQESCTPSISDQSRLQGGDSLVVQWLGLLTFTDEGMGSIPGWGTKIPQAAQRGQKKKKKKIAGKGNP